MRWCDAGHTWIDQGDGTVSPSWGLGGTHMPVDDTTRCPAPRTDEHGRYWCEDCAKWKWSLHDCLQGLSFAPWEKKEWCRPPAPACLKPAVGDGHRWEDQYLPFDRRCWCAWWVRKQGPWSLTFHQGHASRLWTATYRCLDVHTGEFLDIDRAWSARRARIEEYPEYLRARWWSSSSGTLIGCWSTMRKDGAGYLIEGRLVETWVRDAVQCGVATSGQQLTLDVAG